MNKNLD